MNQSHNNQFSPQKDYKPVFSVVIPTKNRSFLIGYAVKSVLMQSFQDFEVIVVDNDDTEETRGVIETINNPKIRYFRTGNLPMPENWDYGCQKMNGQYLMVLEDKMALKPKALETIFSIITKSDPPVITWEHDFFDEEQGIGHPGVPVNGKDDWTSSDQVVESFVNCDIYYFIKYSPRGYNSCVRKDIVDLIYKGPFGHLCIPTAPDYTMAFQILDKVDKIVYISKVLVTMGGLRYSNGLAFHKKKEFGNIFLREQNKTDPDLYTVVPIKTRTTMNFLINDFIPISQTLGGRLLKYPLNMYNYYIYIYDEIIRMKNDGAEISQEMKAWNDALMKQDDALIKKVRREIIRINSEKKQRNDPGRMADLVFMIPQIGVIGATIGIFRSMRWKLRALRKCNNILEYVKKEY